MNKELTKVINLVVPKTEFPNKLKELFGISEKFTMGMVENLQTGSDSFLEDEAIEEITIFSSLVRIKSDKFDVSFWAADRNIGYKTNFYVRGLAK